MAIDVAKIRKRTVVGTSIALGLAALLWLTHLSGGGGPLLVMGTFMACWGLYELGRMGVFQPGFAALGLLATAVGVACELWFLHAPHGRLLGMVMGTAALGCLLSLSTARAGALEVLLAWGLIVGLPGLYLVERTLGISGLVGLLVLAKVGDIAGYYAGSAWGRSHPFPRISPGKTTAGCVASLVVGTLAGGITALLGWWPEPALGPLSGWLWGALINVAAQASDLLESYVKRRFGVKDSGRAFGPSGGLLDLVDSLVLAVPVALLAGPWIFQ